MISHALAVKIVENALLVFSLFLLPFLWWLLIFVHRTKPRQRSMRYTPPDNPSKVTPFGSYSPNRQRMVTLPDLKDGVARARSRSRPWYVPSVHELQIRKRQKSEGCA